MRRMSSADLPVGCGVGLPGPTHELGPLGPRESRSSFRGGHLPAYLAPEGQLTIAQGRA
jgi:hypothetical protein